MKAAFRLILLLFGFFFAGSHHSVGADSLFKLAKRPHQLSTASINIPRPVATLSVNYPGGGRYPGRSGSTENSQGEEEEEEENSDKGRKKQEHPHNFAHYFQSEIDFHDVAGANRQWLSAMLFIYPSPLNKHLLLGVIRI